MVARFGGTYTIRVMGFRSALLGTALLTALFTAAPALFNTDTSLLFVLASLLFVGFFRAAHYVASQAIAFAEVASDEVSRASTLSTVIQQISMSIGISFAGVTLFLSAGATNTFTPQQSSCHLCPSASSHWQRYRFYANFTHRRCPHAQRRQQS